MVVANDKRRRPTVDWRGREGLSRAKSAGRIARHVVTLISVTRWGGRLAARLENVLESTGLDRVDGRRPDGIVLFSLQQGKERGVGMPPASAQAPSLRRPEPRECRPLRREEQRSTIFLSLRFFFVPFAVETIGVLGQTYAELVKELVGQLKAHAPQWTHSPQATNARRCGWPRTFRWPYPVVLCSPRHSQTGNRVVTYR